jgi:acetyl-CoA acetyltransferase
VAGPSSYDGIVIAGWGQSPYHKRDHRPLLWYLAGAVRGALSSASVAKKDVDGLAVTSFQLPPDNATTVAEHLGIPARWVMHGVHGGASGIVSILQAARAIQHGDAEVVVCAAMDVFDVAQHMDLMDRFNPSMRDYVATYGFGGTNGLFAMVEQRHRHEYGTTREQLGALAVTQRRHAMLNPNALLRSPMTLDDYLTARPIALPIRLYDCVLPCAGADAVVVMSEDRARSLRLPRIRILSGGQKHNHRPEDVIVLNQGWESYRDQLWSDAGLGPEDIDTVQLYDDYPIMEVIQFEDLGFCAKGEGGPWVGGRDLSIRGKPSLNTGGGQLSAGQAGASGGMIAVTEAICQLRGEAGARQVAGARTALCSGFGMVAFARGLSTSAMVLGMAP